jgi:hypothetical protein
MSNGGQPEASHIQPIGGIAFGPTALIEAVDWTRARLDAFGVPFPAGNRLLRAQALLRQVQARRVILAPENPELDLVTEAQWTIHEQYFATRGLGLPDNALSALLRSKFEEMLSGAETPEGDRNPRARSTQFELYMTALFKMGGVRAAIAEPDIVIDYCGTPTGVAAKRVNSPRQAVRRAKEAADQLLANGRPGFVAVNVDSLLKLRPDLPGPEATLADRLREVDQIESAMWDRDHVLGTITLGREAVWDFSRERPAVSASSSIRFAPHPRTASGETEARSFFNQMSDLIDRRMNTL